MTPEFGVNPTGFLLQNSFLVGVLVRAKGGVASVCEGVRVLRVNWESVWQRESSMAWSVA